MTALRGTTRPVSGSLGAVNPLVLLGAGLLVDVVLLTTLTFTTAAVGLAVELLLTPLARVPLASIARRLLPVAVAALFAGVTIALYGRTSGHVLAHFALATISDGSLALALATALRLLAIALPAVVLLAGLDATRLADALGQRLRLPARFVLAGLAATRLVELFADDWRTLALARRARGVGDGNRVRRFAGQSFGLLVVALRRATSLATAMEARGFGGDAPRTWARASTFGRPDAVVIALGVLVAGLVLATGIVTGGYGAVSAA